MSEKNSLRKDSHGQQKLAGECPRGQARGLTLILGNERTECGQSGVIDGWRGL